MSKRDYRVNGGAKTSMDVMRDATPQSNRRRPNEEQFRTITPANNDYI